MAKAHKVLSLRYAGESHHWVRLTRAQAQGIAAAYGYPRVPRSGSALYLPENWLGAKHLTNWCGRFELSLGTHPLYEVPNVPRT